MIRIILYRLEGTGDWIEGVLHTFNDCMAVVEKKSTGELEMVAVKKENLKFAVLTEKWVLMQIEAQQRAQQQSVMAPPVGMIRR